MKLQRDSNVYLLISLIFYTFTAINAQLVTGENNFTGGDMSTANNIKNDLFNIAQCLNNITSIENILKLFGPIMNAFLLLPEALKDHIIHIFNYILENVIIMILIINKLLMH